MTQSREALRGSHRAAVGTITGPVPDDEVAEVTLVLRRRGPAPEPGSVVDPGTFADRFGAAPDDLALVREVVAEHGLAVVAEHAASRRVRVRGAVADLSALLATEVHRIERSDGLPQTRMRSGELSLPSGLTGVVTAVLGLDDRPTARHRSIIAEPRAGDVSYTPLELAEVYQMPSADGSGQTVAIVELGGGFAQSDLDTYFSGLGLASPSVTAASVDGATNQPGKDPQGADGEVLLDIEVVGAIAPKAEVVVYFAPNTDDGFVDAISEAAHATPTPVALSISWGQSEDQWTAQARTAMDDAIADATTLGVTVTVAAGDNGSGDNDTTAGSAHTDFPASSPHALACGGTTLHATGATVQSETVWNDGGQGGATGGGVSDAFPVPVWQQQVGVPERAGTTKAGRGVPDVAGNADPRTGYQVYVDGTAMVIGGTSAVAPLWAGLVARLAQLAGRPLGLLQPAVYAGATKGRPAPGLRDIVEGSNGVYEAAPGWDPCTGLGVPSAALPGAVGAAGAGGES